MWVFYWKGVLWWGWIVIAASWTSEAASKNRNQSPLDSFLVNQEKLLQVQVNIEVLVPKNALSQHPLEECEAFSIHEWIEQRQFLLSIDELIRPDNDEVQTAQPYNLEQTLYMNEFSCPPPTPEVLVLLSDDPTQQHWVLNCTASLPVLIPILGPEKREPLHAVLQRSFTSVTLMVALWEAQHCWTRRLVHLHPWEAVTRVALRAEMVASPSHSRVTNPMTIWRVHCPWPVRRIFVYPIMAILTMLLFCVSCSSIKKPGQGENEWSDLVSTGDMDEMDRNIENVHQSEHQPDVVDDASSVNYHALAPRPEPDASSSEDEDNLSPPTVARCINAMNPPSPLQGPPLYPPPTARDVASVSTAAEVLCLDYGNRSNRASETSTPASCRRGDSPSVAADPAPTERSVPQQPPPVEGSPSGTTTRRDTFSEPTIECPARSTMEIPDTVCFPAAEHVKHIGNLEDSGSEATARSHINGTPTDVSLPDVPRRNQVTLSTRMKKRKCSPPPERSLPERETHIPTVLNFNSRVQDLVILEPLSSKRNRSECEPCSEGKRNPKNQSSRMLFQSPLRMDNAHGSTMPEDATVGIVKRTVVPSEPRHSLGRPKRRRALTTPSEWTGRTRARKQQRTSPDFSYVSTLPPNSLCSDDDSNGELAIPDPGTSAAMPPSLVVSSSDSSSKQPGVDDGCDITPSVRGPTPTQPRMPTRNEVPPVDVSGPRGAMPVPTTHRPRALWNAVPDIPISLSLLAAAEAAKDTGVWTYADEKDGRLLEVERPEQRYQKVQQPPCSFPPSIRVVRKQGRPSNKKVN
jgi:hypothetical protein